MRVVNHIIPSGDTLFTFTRDFCIDDNKVYCLRHGNAPYACWLEVYDIMDIPRVEFMSAFFLGKGVYDVIADNGYAYFYNFYENELEIAIVDATDPYQPVSCNSYFTNGVIKDIDLNGEYLIAAFDTLGFAILDFTEPSDPDQIWYSDSSSGIDLIAANETLLIINEKGNHNSDINILDISFPTSPEHLSDYQANAKPVAIEIIGNYIYLNGNDGQIEIVDVANPENPIFHTQIDFIRNAQNIHLQDNYAFIACGNDGMKILDISDPSNPLLAGDFNRSYMNINAIGVKNTIAYLANGDESVIIVNIADLQNIIPVNELEFGYPVTRLAVIDDYLFCKAGYDGLYLYSLQDPLTPILLELYQTPYNAGEILEKDGYFILNDYKSIIILQPTLTGIEHIAEIPMQFSLSPNYPNPFNASTTIKYSLPQPADVQITIYNILGQQIASLVNSPLPAGNHSITWSAGDLPSGMYFYKITAGEYEKSAKMILLK